MDLRTGPRIDVRPVTSMRRAHVKAPDVRRRPYCTRANRACRRRLKEALRNSVRLGTVHEESYDDYVELRANRFTDRDTH